MLGTEVCSASCCANLLFLLSKQHHLWASVMKVRIPGLIPTCFSPTMSNPPPPSLAFPSPNISHALFSSCSPEIFFFSSRTSSFPTLLLTGLPGAMFALGMNSKSSNRAQEACCLALASSHLLHFWEFSFLEFSALPVHMHSSCFDAYPVLHSSFRCPFQHLLLGKGPFLRPPNWTKCFGLLPSEVWAHCSPHLPHKHTLHIFHLV